MAFVDILVDVLDGFNGSNGLNINMTAIFPQQPRTVWHYPAVVNLSFRFSSANFEFLSSVSPAEPGIRICSYYCLILKWLWKIFAALVINNTGGFGIIVFIATWSVNHTG